MLETVNTHQGRVGYIIVMLSACWYVAGQCYLLSLCRHLLSSHIQYSISALITTQPCSSSAAQRDSGTLDRLQTELPPCCPGDTDRHTSWHPLAGETGVCSHQRVPGWGNVLSSSYPVQRAATGLITHSNRVLRLPAADRWRAPQLLQIDEGESKTRQINKELHYSYCARIFLRLGETINLVSYQTKPKHSAVCTLSE